MCGCCYLTTSIVTAFINSLYRIDARKHYRTNVTSECINKVTIIILLFTLPCLG